MMDNYTDRPGTDAYYIRRARLEDLDEVLQIWMESQEHPFEQRLNEMEDYEQALRKKIERRDSIFQLWLAEDQEGRILGWQSLSPLTSDPITKHLYAESSTYIRSGQGNQGLEKALIAHALAHARRSSLQCVVTIVAESNRVALYTGEELGFSQIGTLPTAPKNPEMPGFAFLIYEVPIEELGFNW
jgi:L-amino acid N-acyltransferase YncA